MSSRRFTAQCSRASTERDSTTGGSAALRDFNPVYVACGSWLCEKSSTCRARRNISKKLSMMESNNAARAIFDTLLEKCRKHTSPARHQASRVQYDLTPRDAIARRYFYVWRDR